MSTKYRYQNVPEPTDTPDVPRDFAHFADSQWNSTNGVAAAVNQADPVNAGTTVEAVGVQQNFPAGSLLIISASMQAATVGAVIGYFDIRSNGNMISPQFSFTDIPHPTTFPIQCAVMSEGPSRVILAVSMAVSSIQMNYRYINVQALIRG